MDLIIRHKLLGIIYLLAIFYAFSSMIPLYAASSFLSHYFNTSNVSLIYLLGNLLAAFFAIHFISYLHKYHTYKFVSLVIITEIISITAFALSDNIFVVGAFFIISLCLMAITYSIVSIFLEMLAPHKEMGIARGLFSMIIGTSSIVSPFIGAILIESLGYRTMFLISALLLVPFVFILRHYFRHRKEPIYHGINTLKVLTKALKDKNLKGAMIGIFLVQIFFACLVIFLPLYLTSLGIPLTAYLSIITTISLLPFILFPYELGFLADTKWGEKEMLIIGLIIMSLATLVMSITTTSSILFWTLIVLVARIGAVLVDTMTAVYFYRKIHAEDSSLVMVSSCILPSASYVIVGLFGIILAPLFNTHPSMIFMIVGFITLFGISYILPIKDTK
mgnify:CR=1 FL=1